MFRNHTLEQLRADKLSLGVVIRQARTVDIAKAMSSCDFDWLFVDLEHNSMSIDIAAQICVAALDTRITPLVRVPMMDLRMASRALDNGALGIVMPHVDTVEQAREIASALRYQPVGHRSYTSSLPHFNFRPPPLLEATRLMNDGTLITVMLETPEAIANADAIAGVPGIDVLMIGGTDLSLELGIAGQFEHPSIAAAVETVIGATRRHGKIAGIGGIFDPVAAGKYINMGMRMILSGVDLGLMMAAASERTATFRKLLR